MDRATGSTGATSDWLRALRQAMADAHPDKHPGETGWEAMFVAYKAAYDAALREAFTGQELADSVRDAYRKYVIFHSDYEAAEAGTLTLWTLHTWTWQAVDITPYLLITAPTSSAGKSRIFDVARCLVHEPFPVVDPTPAALFRRIDERHPTVMIDEADMITESKPLRSVLNAGFQRGTPVSRASQDYDVFCPKIFSGIAYDSLPLSGATLSRCIQIPMRRKSPGDEIAPFRLSLAMDELAPVKDALRQWALANQDRLEQADPRSLPNELNDRQAEMWAPLLAIADSLGGSWPADARSWATTLTQAAGADPDPAVQILSDCRRVLDEFIGARIGSADLATKRNNLTDREYDADLNANQLGRRLGAFGIHPEKSPFREGGRSGKSQRGYIVRSQGRYVAQWADAFDRYGLTSLAPVEPVEPVALVA